MAEKQAPRSRLLSSGAGFLRGLAENFNPVDLAQNVVNLGIAGYGYLGSKAGLFSPADAPNLLERGLGSTNQLVAGTPLDDDGSIAYSNARLAGNVAPLAVGLAAKAPLPRRGDLQAVFMTPKFAEKHSVPAGSAGPFTLPTGEEVVRAQGRVELGPVLDIHGKGQTGRAGSLEDLIPSLKGVPVAQESDVLVSDLGGPNSIAQVAKTQAGPLIELNKNSPITRMAEAVAHEGNHAVAGAEQRLGFGYSPGRFSNPDWVRQHGENVLRLSPSAKNSDSIRWALTPSQYDEIVKFHNYSRANPFEAYEGNMDEILARMAGALAGAKDPTASEISSAFKVHSAGRTPWVPVRLTDQPLTTLDSGGNRVFNYLPIPARLIQGKGLVVQDGRLLNPWGDQLGWVGEANIYNR